MFGIGRTAPRVTMLVKLWGVGTPDDYQNSLPPKLPTHVGTPDEPSRDSEEIVVTGQIPNTYGARPAENKLALLSLKHSNLTWVGLSTYE